MVFLGLVHLEHAGGEGEGGANTKHPKVEEEEEAMHVQVEEEVVLEMGNYGEDALATCAS